MTRIGIFKGSVLLWDCGKLEVTLSLNGSGRVVADIELARSAIELLNLAVEYAWGFVCDVGLLRGSHDELQGDPLG
jgi:hypothetical protein